MIVAVADAGPLIHLAEIDSLDLFSVLDPVLVPETVYNELEAGGLPSELHVIDDELVEADDESTWTNTDLDAGEVAALAVAAQADAVLLTDDLGARRAAKRPASRFTDRSASSCWHTTEKNSAEQLPSTEVERCRTKRACSLPTRSSNVESNFSSGASSLPETGTRRR